jgi:hypothetical protein
VRFVTVESLSLIGFAFSYGLFESDGKSPSVEAQPASDRAKMPAKGKNRG